mmetsp:Transcript_6198/g.20216  ORF Transcript_6198/g.20216 Transcript_6198/m.20216 type:complete len:131 (+) Transcript_6198:109-501(+)
MLRPASPTKSEFSDEDPLFNDDDPFDGYPETKEEEASPTDYSSGSSSDLGRAIQKIETKIELTTLDDVADVSLDDDDAESDSQSMFREDALFLELRRSQIRQSHQKKWPPPPKKLPPQHHRDKCKVFSCW